MAILTGFPPSNTIHPGIYIRENDLYQEAYSNRVNQAIQAAKAVTKKSEERWHTPSEDECGWRPIRPKSVEGPAMLAGQNFWLKRTKVRLDINAQINGLMHRLKTARNSCFSSLTVPDSLTDVGIQAQAEWQMSCDKTNGKHTATFGPLYCTVDKPLAQGGCPCFMYVEYALVKAMSEYFGVDVRKVWMNTWDFLKVDQWANERMKETLKIQPFPDTAKGLKCSGKGVSEKMSMKMDCKTFYKSLKANFTNRF